MTTTWTKVYEESGEGYAYNLEESEPGVYAIDADALHEIMREAGWAPAFPNTLSLIADQIEAMEFAPNDLARMKALGHSAMSERARILKLIRAESDRQYALAGSSEAARLVTRKRDVDWEAGDAPYEHWGDALEAAEQRARLRGMRQGVRRVRLRAGWRWIVQDHPRDLAHTFDATAIHLGITCPLCGSTRTGDIPYSGGTEAYCESCDEQWVVA